MNNNIGSVRSSKRNVTLDAMAIDEVNKRGITHDMIKSVEIDADATQINVKLDSNHCVGCIDLTKEVYDLREEVRNLTN
jgi:hypothetical protein